MGTFYRSNDPGPRLADVAGLRAQVGMLTDQLWRDPTLATARTQAGFNLTNVAIDAGDLTGEIGADLLGVTAGTATAEKPAVLGADRNLDLIQLATVRIGDADTTLTRGAAGVAAFNGTIAGQSPATPQTISSPGVIQVATTGLLVSRIILAGAVTGATMTQGTANGQVVWVRNEGGTGADLTFDNESVSLVEGGSSIVIAGGSGRAFAWDVTSNRWLPL